MPVSLQVYCYRSMNYSFSNNTSTKIPTNQNSKKRNCKLPVKLNDISTLGQVFDFFYVFAFYKIDQSLKFGAIQESLQHTLFSS